MGNAKEFKSNFSALGFDLELFIEVLIKEAFIHINNVKDDINNLLLQGFKEDSILTSLQLRAKAKKKKSNSFYGALIAIRVC